VYNLHQHIKNDTDSTDVVENDYTGVSEIGALILTGNRTRQKEQLFYLPFSETRCLIPKKNWRDFSLK
jgi:hypothetical protein